ncbi:SDR family oxidoreductase [Chryseobacterium sp.]|uniref:SDR family oxidoreductase n=1 Tax=Chryseobacterium sp. TaxID=1871047 RepID=UPI0035B2A6C0
MKKTILITGTGTFDGFGHGVALGLAKDHKVIAGVLDNNEKTNFEDKIKGRNLNIEIIKLDITNDDDLKKLDEYSVDILVNNAGIGETGPLVDQPFDNFKTTFEVNVFGTFKITQKVLQMMLANKNPGKVLFISSNAGLQGLPNLSSYAGSKHAIEAMASSLKKEMNRYGIKIAVINPGPYATGFNERIMDTAKKWYNKEKSYVDHQDYHYYDEILANGQADPQEIIDEMIRIIPLYQHPYRIFLPEKVADEVKKEQAETWEEQV